MHTTVREAAPAELPEGPETLEWAVLVVHHPRAELLGIRRVVPARTAIELGRESGALGERTLDDPLVSRQHARLEVDARGVATLSDLGSANGTWVDGARVGTLALRAGSVVRVGPVLLYVQRAPASYPMRRSVKAPVLSYATARFVGALRGAVERRGVLFVRGAPYEAWAPYLAHALADASLPEALAVEGAGAVGENRAGVCARGGDTSAEQWLAEDEALRARGALFVAAVGGVDDSLRERTAHMPGLAARGEELPWIAREALGRALASEHEPPGFDHALVSRMLRASWPEDVRGLARWCEAVAKSRPGAQPLRPSGIDLAYFGEPRPFEAEAPAEAAPAAAPSAPGTTAGTSVRFARDGGWFCVGDEPSVDLRTRFALARLLAALVQSHEASRTEAISIEGLVEAGWPGEKMVGDSGANRVYVAIATLRKLGLRECIERREGAYRLAPAWRIEVDPAESPPTPTSKRARET